MLACHKNKQSLYVMRQHHECGLSWSTLKNSGWLYKTTQRRKTHEWKLKRIQSSACSFYIKCWVDTTISEQTGFPLVPCVEGCVGRKHKRGESVSSDPGLQVGWPLAETCNPAKPHIHCQDAPPTKTGQAREAHNKLTLSSDKQSVFVLLIKI